MEEILSSHHTQREVVARLQAKNAQYRSQVRVAILRRKKRSWNDEERRICGGSISCFRRQIRIVTVVHWRGRGQGIILIEVPHFSDLGDGPIDIVVKISGF